MLTLALIQPTLQLLSLQVLLYLSALLIQHATVGQLAQLQLLQVEELEPIPTHGLMALLLPLSPAYLLEHIL